MTRDPQARAYFAAQLHLKPEGRAQRSARCPFHTDGRASLSVNLDTGLWSCKAGCGSGNRKTFVAKLNGHAVAEPAETPVKLGLRRVAEATYEYVDEQGKVVFRKVRNPGKHFVAVAPDGTKGLEGIEPRPLYNLPAVLKSEHVVLCEGEKDADNVQAVLPSGWATTTNFDGSSGPWRDQYGVWLAAKDLFVLEDNDEPGRKHAALFAEAASEVAARVRVVPFTELPEKGDVSDYLAGGATGKQLLERLLAAPEYQLPIEKLFLTCEQLAAEPPKQEDWLIQDFLAAGSSTVLTAGNKMGKSTLTHDCIKCFLQGKLFLGRYPTSKDKLPRKVVYLTEMPQSDLEYELKVCGLWNNSNLIVLLWHRALKYPWVEAMRGARRVAKKVGARLLVIDTFSKWTRIENENDSSETNEVFLEIDRAVADGLCVLVEAHAGYSGHRRGSTALEGNGSIVITLRKPEGGALVASHPSYREFHVVGRRGEFKVVAAWNGKDYEFVGFTGAVQREATQERLLKELARTEAEAMSLTELTKKLGEGTSRTTVQRALEALEKNGVVQSLGEGKRAHPKRYWIRGTPEPEKKPKF